MPGSAWALAGDAGALPDHPWLAEGGPPVVPGAGRLVGQKDFGTPIDAFRRVRSERPCRLVILGEGPMRQELERHAAALGLEDSVSLPGWAENPYAFMSHAALFVLSSLHEGLPGRRTRRACVPARSGFPWTGTRKRSPRFSPATGRPNDVEQGGNRAGSPLQYT